MRKTLWIVAVALALVVSGSALAGEGCSGSKEATHAANKCTESADVCLTHMATKLKNKGWVGVNLEENTAGVGYVIVGVEQDSPAVRAGLREGDVLVAMNGIELSSENKEALKAAKKSMTIGSTVSYTIERKGRSKEVDVTLAEVPEAVMAKWIGEHMLQGHATIELAQN